MKWNLIAWPLLAGMTVMPAMAGECIHESTPERLGLLELYTSEGCSSCPPADRWLSHFVARDPQAPKAVALALHVDYWDYIGWKDAFAQPWFALRQRQQVQRQGSNTVYTPQVMLNGRDYRQWSNPSRTDSILKSLNASAAQAKIRLEQTALKDDNAEISFTAQVSANKTAQLFLAIYEDNLDSKVQAGENAGSALHHDRVVRRLMGPFPVGPTTSNWRQKLSPEPGWKLQDIGIAAFVQDPASGDVLQAMAAPLCTRH